MYDHDYSEKSEVLSIYRGLRMPRSRERLFIRNIFGSGVEEPPSKNLADRDIPLNQMVNRYSSNASELPFHLIGRVYRCTGLEVFREWRKLNPIEQARA